jgi:hypothetical protein
MRTLTVKTHKRKATMKTKTIVVAAALFAGSLALPAFAQTLKQAS